tara:strand:- start:3221 stop:3736 length:516 start_codon:yes stop_codon:yes gene_type:complete
VTRFFLLLIFFSCNNKNIINDFVIKENYAVESITNSTIKYTFNGKLKAIIKLGKMERFNDDQTIYLSEGVKLNFYKNNNLISTLTSEKAEIDEKNNLLKAIVNVTLSDTEGKKLKSSSLFWNRDNDEVYTNENVTIKTKDEIIYGSGFKSDSRFEKYYIKNVKGKFSLNTL